MIRKIACGTLGACVICSTGADTAHAINPLPMLLPGRGAHATSVQTATWLLGARPGGRSTRLLLRFGAQPVTDGAWRVSASRARAAAVALRKARRLTYAEPDVRLRTASALDGHPEQWARAAVVPPDLVAPPVGRVRIGIVDDLIDPTHPDVGPQTSYLNDDGLPPAGPHGTMVASAAAAAAGNGGVMGVLPGAPLVSYATDLTCGDVAEGIDELTDAGVGVINISLTSGRPCATLYAAVEEAIGTGVVVTAAAGNDFEAGNPVEYPAAFPHVLSVASVAPDLSSSGFSNANAAVDIAAPGEQVPVAIPLSDDVEDGAQDGVTLADGTSFAAPIVAGAAAWVRTVRPRLSSGQIADVLRAGARNLERRGWDADTGWGLVSIPGALRATTPAEDPLEPNDDFPFIDGTFFRHPDPPIFRGHGRRVVRATVDWAEDPWDIYRFRMPPHSAFGAIVRPSYGDPDLYAFDGAVRTLARSRRHLVAHSAHYHGKDAIALENSSRRTLTGYLAVNAARSHGKIDAGYRLSVRRIPY